MQCYESKLVKKKKKKMKITAELWRIYKRKWKKEGLLCSTIVRILYSINSHVRSKDIGMVSEGKDRQNMCRKHVRSEKGINYIQEKTNTKLK